MAAKARLAAKAAREAVIRKGALEGMMRNLIYTLISIKEKRDEKK